MEMSSVNGGPKPIVVDGQTAQLMTATAHANLKQLSKSDAFLATVVWIEALIVQTQVHMADCNVDKLQETQARLKQLKSMQHALTAPGGAATGFIF